ncbi:MAG: acyl carrier protein [Thermodesulfobacteriota bacterium]|jgi:acyl carrier protein
MEEVFTKVQQAFHDAFDVDPKLVSIDTTPDDIPGWDSVGHLALASSLESAFGVSLDVDDLMEMENVREIVRILQSKLEKA